ncbi:MAG: DUF2877 domain-containing protein [Desulfovibrionaceae bacterium]|nr:DUF2877 domain-containing protein [Desulfovibrionaceae bacterium]
MNAALPAHTPRALWKGRDVAMLPAAGLRAVVHSVYARACNIQLADGSLLALLAPELPRIAWGAGLAALPRPFSTFVRAGMRCRLSATGLHISSKPSFNLCWNDAPLWEADSVRPVCSASPTALLYLKKLAEGKNWPGWTALSLLHAAKPQNTSAHQAFYHAQVQEKILVPSVSFSYTKQNNSVCSACHGSRDISPQTSLAALLHSDIFLQQAASVCRRLAAAWQADDATQFCTAACGLVGLGVGLTPSGDDFLGGLLAGLRATATPERQQRFVYPLCAALHSAAHSTGVVAASFLRHACRLSFSHTVVAVAQLLPLSFDLAAQQPAQRKAPYAATLAAKLQCKASLQASVKSWAQKPQVLQAAAEALLAFGSTSGADTLAGLLFAGSLTEEKV